MDSIFEYLDQIEEILDNSKTTYFSNRGSVIIAQLRDIIQEMRLNIPEEINKAKNIVQDCERIMDDAKRRAMNIMADAKEAAQQMADEHEVYREALAQADKITEDAKRDAKLMRQSAMSYADEILEKLEATMRKGQNSISDVNRDIDKFFEENLELIYGNRKELSDILQR